MRKLFRMTYESCSGRCYAYSDVMRIHTLNLDAAGAAAFLQRLVQIHEPSCGNDQIQFRLDVDECTLHAQSPLWYPPTFVASFYHYGSLDLFAGKTPLEALNKMIDAALEYYETDEYKTLASVQAGLGHDVCEHVDDKKLIEFAIAHSGLDDAQKDALREQFA